MQFKNNVRTKMIDKLIYFILQNLHLFVFLYKPWHFFYLWFLSLEFGKKKNLNDDKYNPSNSHFYDINFIFGWLQEVKSPISKIKINLHTKFLVGVFIKLYAIDDNKWAPIILRQ